MKNSIGESRKFTLVISIVIVLLFVPLGTAYGCNEDVSVIILPSSQAGDYYLQEDKVIEIVRSQLLTPSETSYDRAEVRVIYDYADDPAYLIVYLKHRGIYFYETARIILGQDYSVVVVERDYEEQESDLELGAWAYYPVDTMFDTECDYIPTAVLGTNWACDIAIQAGYACDTLIGNQATVQEVRNYLLSDGMKAWGNIGHGNTTGIKLYDASLTYDWFDSLSNTALNGIVIYLNSCKVHNHPLETSIMNAGTRTFIGGDVNLPIGTSEEVFKCFWDDVLLNSTEMGVALAGCEQSEGLTGYHSISGDTGVFGFFIFNPLSHQSNYLNAPRYSAIAISSMIINKLSDLSATDPVVTRSQPDIINFIEDYTGTSISDLGSTCENVQSILEQFTGDGNCYLRVGTTDSGPCTCAPSPVGGPFNWTLFKQVDVNKLLYDIAYWQMQNQYAAAVPTSGDYCHWVAIEGVSADVFPMQNPYPDNYPTNYPLRGFFVDDPGETGGYEKSFQAALYWIDPSEGYFLPTDGSHYEAVIEPPAVEGTVTLTEPTGTYVLDYDPRELARQGVAEMRLSANPRFSAAYADTSAGTPIFVGRTDGGSDFYLVPFLKGNGRITVVVRLKADKGQLMGAAYNVDGNLEFPIDPNQAYDPTLQFFWEPGAGQSPYHPIKAPDGLLAYPRSKKVELYWNAVMGATYYNIYRYGALYKTGVMKNNFIDYNVADGTEYTYTVTATTSTGYESPKTDAVSAIPTRTRTRR